MFTALHRDQRGTEVLYPVIEAVLFSGRELTGAQGQERGVHLTLAPGHTAKTVFLPMQINKSGDANSGDEEAFVIIMNDNGKTVAKYRLSHNT